MCVTNIFLHFMFSGTQKLQLNVYVGCMPEIPSMYTKYYVIKISHRKSDSLLISASTIWPFLL